MSDPIMPAIEVLIIRFLDSQRGEWISAEQIARGTGLDLDTVRQTCQELASRVIGRRIQANGGYYRRGKK